MTSVVTAVIVCVCQLIGWKQNSLWEHCPRSVIHLYGEWRPQGLWHDQISTSLCAEQLKAACLPSHPQLPKSSFSHAGHPGVRFRLWHGLQESQPSLLFSQPLNSKFIRNNCLASSVLAWTPLYFVDFNSHPFSQKTWMSESVYSFYFISSLLIPF